MTASADVRIEFVFERAIIMGGISTNGLYAVLAGMCSVSFIYFSMYMLVPARKDPRIRPLVYTCLLSCLWCVCYVLYYLSGDPATRDLFQRFIYAGMLVFTFLLWFLIRFTGFIKNNRTASIISIIIWFPTLAHVYKGISENAVAMAFPLGFWYLYAEIQTTVYNLLSLTLLIIFNIKKKTIRNKRRAAILSVSAILFIFFSWIADYLLGFQKISNLMPLWLLMWIGLLLYTIKKYRLITVTPEFINRDITENIEEGIILLDQDFNVIFENKALRQLAGANHDTPLVLQNLFAEYHILDEELTKLAQGEGIFFTARINLTTGNDSIKNTVDIKVKKVIDTYNDNCGFLLILSRVKEIGQLKTLYGISNREIDVIRQIEAGRATREIAEILSITERTVETHITSIYHKIGINNRIELLNLLSEFNQSSAAMVVSQGRSLK